MRRSIRVALILTIAIGWLVTSALNTAWAQRDPFDPLVEPDSQVAEPAPGEAAPAEPAPPAAEEPSAPSLPRTGVAAFGYLLAAAVFIGVGGALIRLDRWVAAPV